jgi:hypothetical protein
MEGTYLYSPFYPNLGGNSSPSTFKIGSFTNNKPFNERGIVVTDVRFDWIYLNGTPTSQSIIPAPGMIVPNSLTSFLLTGQHIEDNTVFTLHATDGKVNRTLTTKMFFNHPVYFGGVTDALPSEADILAMDKHIADYVSFTASLNLDNERSCFVSPMANPITDIREKVLGFSILNTYDVIDNYYLTMADGFAIPCRVMVKKIPEHTLGMPMQLEIIF